MPQTLVIGGVDSAASSLVQLAKPGIQGQEDRPRRSDSLFSGKVASADQRVIGAYDIDLKVTACRFLQSASQEPPPLVCQFCLWSMGSNDAPSVNEKTWLSSGWPFLVLPDGVSGAGQSSVSTIC